MEEKKVMKEPEENSEWTKVTKLLAGEIISGSRRESKAKSFAIICLATAVVIISIGSAVVNYKNDREWRELITSYNYASEKVLGNQKVGE